VIFHGTKIYGKAHIFNSENEKQTNNEIINYIREENNWHKLSSPKKYTILSLLELEYIDTIENECSPFNNHLSIWKSDLKVTFNNKKIVWIEANGTDHFNGFSFNISMTAFYTNTYRFFSKLQTISNKKDSILCINMLIPYCGDLQQLSALKKMVNSNTFKNALNEIYNNTKWININLKSKELIFRRKLVSSQIYLEDTPKYFQEILNKCIIKNPFYINQTVNIFNNLLQKMIADKRYEIYV